jgi:hypothetical protein
LRLGPESALPLTCVDVARFFVPTPSSYALPCNVTRYRILTWLSSQFTMFVLAAIVVGLFLAPVEAAVYLNSTSSKSSASTTTQATSTTDLPSTSGNSSSSSSASTSSVAPYCDPTFSNCNEPGDPDWNLYEFDNPYLLAGNNDSAMLANPSLRSFCSNSWESQFSQYRSTASWSTMTITESWPATTEVATIDNYREDTTETFTYSAETFTETMVDYPFAASLPMSSPCCFDCTLWGGSIEVYYWPSTTSSSSFAHTLVNSEGYSL